MNIGTSVTLEELEGFRERAAMGEINVVRYAGKLFDTKANEL